MSPWQACLFDCDGTLVDTEGLVVDVVAAWLAERAAPVERDTLESWIVGLPWRSTWFGIGEHLAAHGQTLPTEAIAKSIQGRLQPGLLSPDRVLPQRFAALRLAAQCMPVDIVSGSHSDEVRCHLRNAGALDCVRRVLGSDTYTRGKPDPEPYRLACKLGNHHPAQCLVIEDSVVGVASGLAAGCQVLGVAQGPAAQRLRQAGAHWVWPELNPTEWLSLLNGRVGER